MSQCIKLMKWKLTININYDIILNESWIIINGKAGIFLNQFLLYPLLYYYYTNPEIMLFKGGWHYKRQFMDLEGKRREGQREERQKERDGESIKAD